MLCKCGNKIIFEANKEFIYCQKCGLKNFKDIDYSVDIKKTTLDKLEEFKNENYVLFYNDKELLCFSFKINEISYSKYKNYHTFNFSLNFIEKYFIEKNVKISLNLNFSTYNSFILYDTQDDLFPLLFPSHFIAYYKYKKLSKKEYLLISNKLKKINLENDFLDLI